MIQTDSGFQLLAAGLIIKFVTVDRKNQDPYTREGAIHSKARQQMLRDRALPPRPPSASSDRSHARSASSTEAAT